MSKGTTRVQLELSKEAMTRLKNLKKCTDAVSYSEIVRTALKLYERMHMAEHRGETIMMQNRDGMLHKLEGL